MKKVLFFVTGLVIAGVAVSALNRPAHPPAETITTVESIEPILGDTTTQSVSLTSKAKNVKRVHNLKPSNNRTLLLWGEVNESALGLAEEIKALASESHAPIYLLINSPGGSVLDGAQIVSAIEASKAPVYTVCMQLCASMAAIIHQYGTERMMSDRAILMFHNAAGGTQGYVPQMLSRLNLINKYVNKMNAFIANRKGTNLTEWLAKMDNEVWIDAEDATASRLNDKIVSVVVPQADPLAMLNLPSNKAKSKINLNWE